MFNRDRRNLFFSPGSRSRIAIGLICLIAEPFQSLHEDFATVLMLSMGGWTCRCGCSVKDCWQRSPHKALPVTPA
jgi:hypothetical protein